MLSMVRDSSHIDAELARIRKQVQSEKRGRHAKTVRYSSDLKKQILRYWSCSGMGVNEAAKAFGVSTHSLDT